MRSRNGFALLAVLWVIVSLVALGVGASMVARQALGAARNRIDLTRAEWKAEGCMEELRAEIAQILLSPPAAESTGLSTWSALDKIASGRRLRNNDCSITMRPVGARLDVNVADPETLTLLLARLGVSGPRRDSMIAALMDWRDADADERVGGAERAWYVRNGRIAPRDGPFADVRELHRVRGFETLDMDSVLDVESGRTDLNRASLAVIASLPGFSEEAVSRIAEMRGSHRSVADLSTFSGELSPGGRQLLLTNYAELTRTSVTEPDAWIVSTRANAGVPAVVAMVELRLVRAGTRAAIVRRRSWIL